MIFLEEEFRAFCPTGEGGGIKNDCSPQDGSGPSPKADNSWKREQGPVRVTGDSLKASPPAKSLAGVKSVVIMDGELVNKSLREVGVTLDQAAKACAALDPESEVTIAHGGLREIIEFMGSDDPERYIEDTVTFTSVMPVAGIEGAARTAASLTREEGGDLVMSYTMLMISDEAKKNASVAVARHMMKGTVASITQAEKIGVSRVEMLAAGDASDGSDFKGYRIWPRLGFNGVIPRKQITPTWSLARGFFNSYGSGIPDKILSPRARKEKAAGALTIQALYETKEGQEWWEKKGGEMEMSLSVGDKSDSGWKRFLSLRDRFSKRGMDLADAFFDVEARSLLDGDWAEYRDGGCEKAEGGRFAPGNDCAASDGSGPKADDSWKRSSDGVSLSGNALHEKPPYAGADKAGKVDIPNPQALAEGMSQAGIKSLDDLAAMAGATLRGSEVVFSGAGHPDIGAYISVENKIPLSRDGTDSDGHFSVNVSVYREGKEYLLGLNEMLPSPEVTASGERVARATSLMQQAVIESILGAERSGISRVTMSAAGGSEYDLKGYRLWPQFGFDAALESSHRHALAKASPEVVEKVMRAARPDLFATRIKPPHAALAAALPQSQINVQHLISFHEGDVWWNKNGSTLGMSLDLSDKKSLGYARFQKQAARLKKLRERNQDRAYFEWLEEEAEFRAGADCGRDESGRFGSGNDCASEDGGSLGDEDSLDMGSEAVSASPPFKGAEVLDSFSVNDVPSLKGILSDMGRVKTVENVVAISGGVRQGGSISIDSYGEAIIVNSSIPVSPDGSDQLGHIKNMVSLMKDDDGYLVVNYDSMSLDPAAMASLDGENEGDSPNRRRIVSMVLERMTESLSVAEESGAIRADTIAAGNSGSALQGYRLWPQFGFDGTIDEVDVDAIKADVKLTPYQRRRANTGDMTVQDLIATPEGDKWWNENGSTIELTLDFTDQTTAGYKRFERMKGLLDKLKKRNKNRSAFEDGVENRDAGCEQEPNGQFAKGNDCAGEDGGGTAVAEKKPKSTKKPEAFREPLKWSPGDSHVDIFREASQNNPTKKSENGKKILSTSIPGAKVVRGLAGKDEIEPLDVGKYLLARQAEHRGRIIDTTKPLSGDDFEYMVSGIASQVDSAVSRGVSPNFYSPEDRKAQVEVYAKVQPLMRGGRTASGFCIGIEGPSGECEPSDGISPQAEFLFRAAQALTSPEANPYENMLRADSVLTAFFEEPDPSKAKLGAGIAMAGAGAQNTLTNFARLQKIIDRVGLEETRRLFSGPSISVKDFEDFFLSKVPGSDGDRYEANSYAVAEVVPPFSIFGPKVGPFFANNTGDTEALTADIWFTRTWGRLSGELVSQTSADRAKKHGTELMSATGAIGRKELESLSLDGRGFRTLVSRMKQKGEIAQQIVDWAEARKKQYEKDGFPSPKKGTGTEKRYKLDRLAVNILNNQASLMAQPGTTVMRSNMIRVMREAAKRTGVSVAYMQDILWQDEQDTWGLLGSRTTTVPGVPSLYSDVIRKIVDEPQNLNDRRRESKRSISDVAEPMPLPFYADQKGGLQQAMYDEFLSGLSDDEFADLAVEFLAKKRKSESRAFCPTGDGGGIDNSCGSDDASPASSSPSSSRSPESLPKSFPRGSEKFRDAIDSVSPNPKAVWDRARGRADTPPEKILTTAADEQTSSGTALTPEAEASYKDLVDEIGRQYEALTAAGLKAKAWRGEGEPYGDPPGSTKPNSDRMREEVAKTGEFSFFMTEKGFGTGSATPDHPMLRETKYKTADGEPMIANDLFRVVHDMVAHVRGGYSFSTNGEYNGMLTHASTLPESAWPALFAETFGQNAVYEKTGNYAAQNAYASKIGPEIIKAELEKRNRKARRAVDAEDEGDEPLGYQHLKVRPWLMDGVSESRSADCGRDEGGRFGSGNDCAKDGSGAESPKKSAKSFPQEIKAGDTSLKNYVPFRAVSGTKNSDFAKPAEDDSLKAAIAAAKGARFAERYGAPRELPQGSPVAIRIDVPTFKKSGAYAVTVHRATKGGFDPSPVGYDSVARLDGPVVFESKENDAVLVAAGLSQKFPLATVKGALSKDRSIPDDIDDWTAVGYDPQKAAYFYDKRTGDEVVGGTDSISVGNSVFVRKPTYAKSPRNAAKQYRSAGFWGLESRADDCGRDESGRFGSGNDCAKDGGDGTSPLKAAAVRWKGSPSDLGIHIQDELDGRPVPPSGTGKKLRAMAAALLEEVKDNSEPAPVLYRGDDKPPAKNSSPLLGWTSNKRVAAKWARERGGQVYELKNATGVKLKKITGDALDGGEDEWIVMNRRSAQSYRSADCGRDESGKFGSGNDCASDGEGGTATAAASGDRWSSNETLSWPETSRDSSPPPVGDGRYGSIDVSAPKAVKASLDAAGIDPKLAPMVAGGSDESDVFVRPAPDFSMEFPGSDVTPVMFAFERDFAGVESGMRGSSVIGVTASGETVVYHSTVNVSDSIKKDDSKRHAAAREFYRAMTSSVESARKSGVSRIVLNAAGNSSATKGSLTSTPWRGYTIWPRMGFDAPLPPKITAKLPPDLSHAKSLLDLHATPEGTRWWRDNGEDLDVTFDLKDRSSPQAKIMDRFIKKFGESRREMPLGAGDDWMSPEDLVRLDEMWQEIWDEGDLDDYEWVESRSADCGRDDSGRFGPKNDCASDDSQPSSLPASTPRRLTKESVERAFSLTGPASNDPSESLRLLQTGRRFEVVGSFRKNIDHRKPSEAADFADEFLSGLGSKTNALAGDFIADIASRIEDGIRDSRLPRAGADNAACLLASISSAVTEHPPLLSAPLTAMNSSEVFDSVIADGDGPEVADMMSKTSAAMYSISDGTITVNTDTAMDFFTAMAETTIDKTRFFSSSHPGHALIHEHGHLVHYEALRKSLGIATTGKISRTDLTRIFDECDRRANAVVGYFRSGAAGRRAEKKVLKLSQYGATHPSEFVAEYYTGLATKAVSRDGDLDKVMDMLGFPSSAIPEGKKKRGTK